MSRRSPFSARVEARRAEVKRELGQLQKHTAQKAKNLQWSYSKDSTSRRKVEGSPAAAATFYVAETLGEYSTKANLRPRYLGMQREAGSGQYGITDGTIDIVVEVTPLGGMKQVIEVPVMVKAGYMLQPGIFFHHGTPYIISQSSVDQLMDDARFSNEVRTDRPHMFSPPASNPKQHTALPRFAGLHDAAEDCDES